MEFTEAKNGVPASPWMQSEVIARLAHAKWMGRQHTASEVHDWLEAESELRLVGHLSRELMDCKLRLSRMSVRSKRMKRVLAAQHAVGSALARSHDLRAAAEPILSAIARCVGWDQGRLWLVDRQAGVLRLSAVWRDPRAASGETPWTEHDTLVPGVDLASRVWASGLPLSNRASSTSAAGNGAERPGVASATAVAIPIRNDVLYGVMEFSSREAQPADDQLLELLADLGYQIGQFIERDEAEERLREQDADRRIARQIQEGLLPQSMPCLPGFAIAGRCWPAQIIGGDCFDFMSVGSDGEERLGVMVADASGHGVAAALMVAETRAYLRALALQSADVGSLVTLTNRRLTPDTPTTCAFVTLFLARLDVGARTLTYVSAGHCPACVLSGDGQTRSVLNSTGWPLAIDGSVPFKSSPPIVLQPGDIVFIYSDGLTEAMSAAGELFGLQRATDYVRAHRSESVEEILEGLFQAVSEYSGRRPQADDITAVIIKVDPIPPGV